MRSKNKQYISELLLSGIIKPHDGYPNCSNCKYEFFEISVFESLKKKPLLAVYKNLDDTDKTNRLNSTDDYWAICSEVRKHVWHLLDNDISGEEKNKYFFCENKKNIHNKQEQWECKVQTSWRDGYLISDKNKFETPIIWLKSLLNYAK